jgi:hypothetical protein
VGKDRESRSTKSTIRAPLDQEEKKPREKKHEQFRLPPSQTRSESFFFCLQLFYKYRHKNASGEVREALGGRGRGGLLFLDALGLHAGSTAHPLSSAV